MTTGPSGSQAAQARVARSIRDTIEGGHLRDGDVLPSSTRELESPPRPEVIDIGGYAGSGTSALDPAYAAGAGRALLGDTAASGLDRAAVLIAGGGGARVLGRAVRCVCEATDGVVRDAGVGMVGGPG